VLGVRPAQAVVRADAEAARHGRGGGRAQPGGRVPQHHHLLPQRVVGRQAGVSGVSCPFPATLLFVPLRSERVLQRVSLCILTWGVVSQVGCGISSLLAFAPVPLQARHTVSRGARDWLCNNPAYVPTIDHSCRGPISSATTVLHDPGFAAAQMERDRATDAVQGARADFDAIKQQCDALKVEADPRRAQRKQLREQVNSLQVPAPPLLALPPRTWRRPERANSRAQRRQQRVSVSFHLLLTFAAVPRGQW